MFRNFYRSFSFALILIPVCAAGQSTPASTEPAANIHANTNLVVVDVVVTDGHQNPVQHLTASDFTFLEDGKPQKVKVFEEHAAGTPVQFLPAPKLEAGNFTNYTPAPENGPLNILLFDKLNTPVEAQTELRDQVLKYLKELKPGTPMAIFSLNTQLSLLQGFTSDPEQLRALVNGKKGTPGAGPLREDPLNGDEPGSQDLITTMTSALTSSDLESEAHLRQFETKQQDFRIELRQRYTLDALNMLARYMSGLPGRKNLIWFSGSFPAGILPDSVLEHQQNSRFSPAMKDPSMVVASAEDEFRETTDLLARSQVAVYPIDVRGVMAVPGTDTSQQGQRYTDMHSPDQLSNDQTNSSLQTQGEQGTMNEMAEATGGKAFVNTNDLKEAVQKAIDTGSNYYTVAYVPTNTNWNGAFRKIEVKIDRPKVTLAYRRGYFADDPTKSAHRNQPVNSTANATQSSAIHTAMKFGGPDPTELIFSASVRPASADTEPSLAPGNQAAKTISGPYRRYNVTFVTNPKDINCSATPDGVHHCAVEFLTFVYDADGALINTQANGIGSNVPDAEYAPLLKRSISFRQQISVPEKGEYFLRIGMHDRNTDNVGALELPVASVAKLPPESAPTPVPASGTALAPDAVPAK